jgi:hypothetical protein
LLYISDAPGTAVWSQQDARWEALTLLHSAKLRPATDNSKAPQILEAEKFEGQIGLRHQKKTEAYLIQQKSF